MAFASSLVVPAVAGASPLFGVNLSGLEFGSGNTANVNYDAKPTLAGSIGTLPVQVVRVPFKLERLEQAGAGAALDGPYLGYIKAIIQADEAGNVVTVLDPHDYGYIGTDGTTREIGVDPVGTSNYLKEITLLAGAVHGMSGVAIGLMNEPHAQTCAELYPVWQQAITAIRGQGFSGPIMVPPTNYAGATTFVSSGCAADFLGLADPDNDLVSEIHMYQDGDGSGTYNFGKYSSGNDAPSIDVGTQRLASAVAWAQANGTRLYLGETGVTSSAYDVAVLQDTLTDVKDAGVFWGVTMWSAGQWWGVTGASNAYKLDLNLQASGAAAPQMATMETLIAKPGLLTLHMAEDAYQGDAKYTVQVDGSTVLSSVETMTRLDGVEDAVTIPGPFASGPHTVKVTFLNDAYGGSAATDRNLYVMSSTFNGALLNLAATSLRNTGNSATVSFTAP